MEVAHVDSEVSLPGDVKETSNWVRMSPAHLWVNTLTPTGDYVSLRQTPLEYGAVVGGGFNCTGGELKLEKNKRYFVVLRDYPVQHGCIVEVKDATEVLGKNWSFSKIQTGYEPGPYKAVPPAGLFVKTSTEPIFLQPGVMKILKGEKSLNDPADQTSGGLSLEETLKNALPSAAGSR